MTVQIQALNTEQRRAVETDDGPLLIVAGPGTGKTKTLTARITYLVQSGRASTKEILALTFTNKAAGEMQERVTAALGKGKNEKPTIVTFHALAHLLLGLPEKSKLIDDIERVGVLQLLAGTEAGRGFAMRDMSLVISRAKNQPQASLEPNIRKLVDAYNAELHTRDLYDYDDLLIWLHDALVRPDFQRKAQRFTHILVDEFQDTNDLQYQIVRRLNRTDNLFVIGDPLQSIYGFRGASSKIFDQFEQDFPQARRVQLLTNYRSAPEIVRLSTALFPDAPALQAYRRESGKAQSIEVLNEYGEADWIVRDIERQVGGHDMLGSSKHHGAVTERTFDDFAIMSRTHAGAGGVQAALEKSGIPYQVVGEGSPFLQPHATGIIQSFAYLAGFGEAPVIGKLKPTQVAKLLDPLKPIIHNVLLTELAQRITSLLNLGGEKKAGAVVKQFHNSLLRHNDMHAADYVRHVQAMAEQEYYDPAAGAVTVLTIHASKGLEFPVVYLLSVEEGNLPLARRGVVVDPEEEKRLLYVAVTRARDELYLLHARTRKGEKRELSSFLTALPKGIIEEIADEGMSDQLKRIQRRALKHAQGSLF